MWLRFYLFIILSLNPLIVRALSAHNHDEVMIQIAFESGKGLIDLTLPAIVVLGFEQTPKNPRELKKANDAIEEFRNRVAKWFYFNPELQCTFSNSSAEWIKDSTEHSELIAKISFECKKPLLGQSLKLHLRNSYPQVKSIKIEALIETLQKSWILNKKQNQIEFK